MAGKKAAGPHFTASSGRCSVDQGTNGAAIDLNNGRVPEETGEAEWQQRKKQVANSIQECHVCRFIFNNTQSFQKHAADHSLGKNENCPQCGKLFRWPSELTRHLLFHGEPSLQCGLCGHKFRRKDHLKNHMLAWHIGSQD